MNLSRLGLVVHPTRDVLEPLGALRDWAAANGVDLVQVAAPCQQQPVAERGDAGECDVIVSIGGDGTSLAALRTAVEVDRPALGIACGSLGVLTTVTNDGVGAALERVGEGDWVPLTLPALQVARDPGEDLYALNDLAVVRAGAGQVFTTACVDGELFARLAGDGCVASTPVGSSAYALAAGGPLLGLRTEAFLFTPLTTHGGNCPPLVLEGTRQLELQIAARYGGARLEIDGQVADREVGSLTITLDPRKVTVVGFSDQEPFLTGLRRRGIIADSPRILAEHRSA